MVMKTRSAEVLPASDARLTNSQATRRRIVLSGLGAVALAAPVLSLGQAKTIPDIGRGMVDRLFHQALGAFGGVLRAPALGDVRVYVHITAGGERSSADLEYRTVGPRPLVQMRLRPGRPLYVLRGDPDDVAGTVFAARRVEVKKRRQRRQPLRKKLFGVIEQVPEFLVARDHFKVRAEYADSAWQVIQNDREYGGGPLRRVFI